MTEGCLGGAAAGNVDNLGGGGKGETGASVGGGEIFGGGAGWTSALPTPTAGCGSGGGTVGVLNAGGTGGKGDVASILGGGGEDGGETVDEVL